MEVAMIRNLLLAVQSDTLLGGRIATVVEELGMPWGTTVEAVVVLVLIVGISYVFGRVAVIPFVDRFMDHRDVDRHLQLTLLKFVHLLVISGAVGIGLYVSGYTFLLGALVAGLAAGGLSIGFALQGAVRNVVAGLFIYAEKPFRIGDEIEWDDNAGIVQDINLRVTRIQSFDNKLVTVPNSKLTDGVTKNPVRSGPLRLEIDFPIDLKANIDDAKEIIVAEAADHEKILDSPEPVAFLMDFEESHVRLQARIWLANRDIGDRVRIRDEFATAVKASLEEAGIDIPYPHRRLSREPEPAKPEEETTDDQEPDDHDEEATDGTEPDDHDEEMTEDTEPAEPDEETTDDPKTDDHDEETTDDPKTDDHDEETTDEPERDGDDEEVKAGAR